MFATLSAISMLLTAVIALSLGLGLQGTLVSLRAQAEGFPIELTGAVMTVYFIGYMIGTRATVHLIERVGHTRTFAAMAALASSGVLLHPVFVDPYVWSALRIVTGFSCAGMVVIIESWVNDAATNENRGGLLAIYMVTALLAAAGGQLLLNIGTVDGFELFILVSILISCSLVPLALSTQNAPPIRITPKMPMTRLLSISPLGVVACFTSGILTAGFSSLGAVFAYDVGLNTWQISLFMAAFVVGGVAGQWPLGRLSDRIDRRIVISALSFVAAFASLAIAIVDGMVPMALLILSALYGAANFPLYAVTVAHVNDLIDAGDFVPVSSAMLFTYAAGAILGPVVCGWAMGAWGAGGMFYVMTVAAAAMGAFSLNRLFFGAKIEPHEKDSFLAVPHTSPQALEMARRVKSDTDGSA